MQGNSLTWFLLAFSIVLAVGQRNSSVAAEAPQKSGRPKLYDTTADGTEEIATALKTAAAENKRLILKFGAEW